jgi:SynChlorMet cassette protein ScmC
MPNFGTTGFDLKLADGNHWSISAVDGRTALIVSQFGEAMQLRSLNYSSPRIPVDSKTKKRSPVRFSNEILRHRLLVFLDEKHSQTFLPKLYLLKSSAHDRLISCHLQHWDDDSERFFHFLQLSLALARQVQACGGVLLHGALAEWGGIGIILAGPGGTGKTTASNRLYVPWRSLSDDLTLVVRDSQKNYWAHPWPTWSQFLTQCTGGEWEVQKAVPLKAIFFLSQAEKDQAILMGKGQAVSSLLSATRQASNLMTKGLEPEEIRDLHAEWLDNLCSLSQWVPVYHLDISLTGPFWQEIEGVLVKDSDT